MDKSSLLGELIGVAAVRRVLGVGGSGSVS
jgi:hypothetical protein